jgi:hypothetical protein
MKRTYYGLLIVIVLITVFLSHAVTSFAQEMSPLVAAEATICRDVVDRQPLGAGTTFEASVGKLFCFTKITGAQGSTEISHIWYFGDTLKANVTLPVRSSSWRTYSSKRIMPHEIGDWHVDVLGPEGKILKTLEFKVTP